MRLYLSKLVSVLMDKYYFYYYKKAELLLFIILYNRNCKKQFQNVQKELNNYFYKISVFQTSLKIDIWQKKYKWLINTSKKYTTSLGIREIQVNITTMPPLTSERMPIITKPNHKTKQWQIPLRLQGKGVLLYCWQQYNLGESLWESV